MPLADTITFASTLSGTITLTQGQLEVNDGPLKSGPEGSDAQPATARGRRGASTYRGGRSRSPGNPRSLR